MAISEIDYEFKKLRSFKTSFKNLNHEDINKAFDRISTLVFAPGYLVAFNYFRIEKKLSVQLSKDDFLKRLDNLKPKQWVFFLTDFMDEMFPSKLTPKNWPILSNMILRVIQQPGEFFDNDSYRDLSPELIIIRRNFDSACDNFRNGTLGTIWNATKYKNFSTSDVNRFINTSIGKLDNMYKTLNLKKDPKNQL